jgi:hypothetical protein
MATTVTKLIKASGGDYTTITAFDAALPSSLVTSDEIWIGELADEDFADEDLTLGGGVSAGGTDATRYIVLRAQNSLARTGSGFTCLQTNTHARIRPTGAYNITSGNGLLTLDNTQYIIAEDLEVDLGGYTSHTAGQVVGLSTAGAGGGRVLVRRCLVHNWNRTATVRLFRMTVTASASAVDVAFVRCVASNVGTATNVRGFYVDQFSAATGDNWKLYACVAQGMSQNGFSLTATFGETITIENCLSVDHTTSDFIYGGAGTYVANNNGSEDLTADDASGSGHLTGLTPDDEIETLDSDWHLESTATSIAAGKDLGGLTLGASNAWNLDVEVDPDGQTPDDWDIGADAVPELDCIAPTADRTKGTWESNTGSTSSLYTFVDESTASDSDYVQVDNPSSSDYVEFDLSTALSNPGNDLNHRLQFRAQKVTVGSNPLDVTGQLRTSTGLVATLASTNLSTGVIEFSLNLSTADAAKIGSITDLRARFYGVMP